MYKIAAVLASLAIGFASAAEAQTTGPIGQQDTNKVGPANPGTVEMNRDGSLRPRTTDMNAAPGQTGSTTGIGPGSADNPATPRTSGIDATTIAPAGR